MIDRGEQSGIGEWPLDEIDGASLHRPHRQWNVAVTGDHDQWKIQRTISQMLLKFEPIHLGHADVDDEAADGK